MKRSTGACSSRRLFRWLFPGALILFALPMCGLFRHSPALAAQFMDTAPPANFSPAQMGTPVKGLTAGRFLVASRKLGDPNFMQTVVLLALYDKNNAMGLVLNRRLKLPVSRLFRNIEEARARTDDVHEGGPVAPTGILGLLRSATQPPGGDPIFGDVYLVQDAELMEKQIKAGAGPAELRIYAGYAGWGAGQLDGEVEAGAWHIFKADTTSVFDPQISTLWDRFIERTELRIALAPVRPDRLALQ